MKPEARKDGTHQRHYATVLARLALEDMARKAGTPITAWRGNRPVICVKAGKRT